MAENMNSNVVSQLQAEISRLQADLEQTTYDKETAAKYGLAVLEEKQHLQQQLYNLEFTYDVMKHELQSTKEAYNQVQLKHKKVSELGVSQEECLLQETATREAQLLGTIGDLELELRTSRQQLEVSTTEREKTSAKDVELVRRVEELEADRRRLRKQAEEMRLQEAQTMTEYSKLEDENVSLQKQCLQLKQAQVEFEATLHEYARLREETEELRSELQESARLKSIIEHTLQETVEMLQHEREQKNNAKKELEQRIATESMYALHTLANLGLGDFRMSHHSDDNDGDISQADDGTKTEIDCSDVIHHEEHDNPALKKIEADFASPKHEPRHQQSVQHTEAVVGDLFSEIHVGEVQKYQRAVEQVELEKNELQHALDESKAQVESLRMQISEQNNKICKLNARLDPGSFGTDAAHDDTDLVRVSEAFPSYDAALKQIVIVQKKLDGLSKTEHIQQSKHDVLLENDSSKSGRIVTCVESSISFDESSIVGLTKINNDLTKLLNLVHDLCGKTPSNAFENRNATNDFKTDDSSSCLSSDGTDSEAGDKEKVSPLSIHLSSEQLPEKASVYTVGSDNYEKTDPASVACDGSSSAFTSMQLFDTVCNQVQHLYRALEKLSLERRNSVSAFELSTSCEQPSQAELQEQVAKLKAMLSTKREQIATLRSVLIANKTTAETALSNLKSKYAAERAAVAETAQRLRSELAQHKEDAATFVSLRAMFAARCDEYATQLNAMQNRCSAADEQNRTLNSLLRMAVQQKLTLAQKVEDLESDRERRNTARSTRGTIRGRVGSATSARGFTIPVQQPFHHQEEQYGLQLRYSPQSTRYQRRDY